MCLVPCLYCQKLFGPGRRHLCENRNGILLEPYRSNPDFQTITVKKEGICNSTSISTENYNNTNNFKTGEMHQNSTFALSTSVSKLGLIGNPQFATSNPTTAEEITNDTTIIPKPKYREKYASEIVNNQSISIQNEVFSVNYDEDIFGDAESVKNMIADILRSDNISQERNRVSNDENCHSILNINQSFESLGNDIGVEYNEITFPNYGETFVAGIPMNRMNPFSICAQNDQNMFGNAHLRNTTPILPIQKNEPNCIPKNNSLNSVKTDPTLSNSSLCNPAGCPETEEEKQVPGSETTTNGNKFEANNKILLKGEESFPGLRFHSEDRRHKCERCGKVFERKEDVQAHICVHMKNKLYKCDCCEKKFQRNCDLERHIRTHTGEKHYKCEYCEKTFTRKDNKEVHIRTHTGVKTYRRHNCERCGKVFERKEDVQAHICVRTGDKRYKCDYCERTFTHKCSKQVHIRTHAGEKPYKCEYCEKTFANKCNKNLHVLTHTGEKPYKCEYCEKTFTQKGNKNAHIRIHTGVKPYKCEYCEMTFTQKGSKQAHVRIHTGEKPYECEYCGKTFTQKCSKQKHTRTHIGEKPNKCRICGRAFTYIKTFKHHKCIITGG